MTLLYPAQGYTCWCSLKLLLQQLLKRGLKMHTWEPRGPDSEHRPFGPIRILRKRFMQMHISAKTEKLSFVRLSKGESRQHFINVQSEFWITNQTRNPRQFAITRHVRWWYMSDKVWVISIRTYEQEKNFPQSAWWFRLGCYKCEISKYYARRLLKKWCNSRWLVAWLLKKWLGQRRFPWIP